MADVCGEEQPQTREDKIAFALRNHIAVWDVLAGCEIRGADDSSIRNPVPNDLSGYWRRLISGRSIRRERRLGSYISAYCYPKTGIEAVILPSTSPANCRVTYEELYHAYARIRKYIT